MPVGGPEYSKSAVDDATKEILFILKNKYRLLTHEPGSFGWDKDSIIKEREELDKQLKIAIEAFFKQDANESF